MIYRREIAYTAFKTVYAWLIAIGVLLMYIGLLSIALASRIPSYAWVDNLMPGVLLLGCVVLLMGMNFVPGHERRLQWVFTGLGLSAVSFFFVNSLMWVQIFGL